MAGSRFIRNGIWIREDFRIRAIDAKAVEISGRGRGACFRGVKSWAKRHGIDWAIFCREGIPVQELIDSGDIRAKVIALKVYRMRLRNE